MNVKNHSPIYNLHEVEPLNHWTETHSVTVLLSVSHNYFNLKFSSQEMKEQNIDPYFESTREQLFLLCLVSAGLR